MILVHQQIHQWISFADAKPCAMYPLTGGSAMTAKYHMAVEFRQLRRSVDRFWEREGKKHIYIYIYIHTFIYIIYIYHIYVYIYIH